MLQEGTGGTDGAESWVTSKVHQRIDTLRDVLWTGLSRDLSESDGTDKATDWVSLEERRKYARPSVYKANTWTLFLENSFFIVISLRTSLIGFQ